MVKHIITKPLIVFSLFSLIISASTWMTPIEFDSAFNFQVANSLLEKFSYESKYIPSKIYHNQITTNGPIQYYLALFIGLFGLDLGRALGLGIIGGLAAVVVYSYSTHAFVLYCLLLFFWPLFAEVHNLFLGETLSITMIVVGLIQWEKWHDWSAYHAKQHTSFTKKIWRNPKLWTTGLAFGTAIATKLMTVGVIPLILFCLSFHTIRTSQSETKNQKSALLTYWIILPALIALAFFFLQFTLSILHSGGAPGSILPSLNSFVSEHLHQANKTELRASVQDTFFRSNGTIIALLLITLGALLYENIAFIIPVICFITLLLLTNINMRRMLPLIVPLMLLSLKITAPPRTGAASHYPAKNFVVLSFSGIALITGYLLADSPAYLLDRLRQFSLAGAQHNVALISKGQSTYNTDLIPIIKNLDAPIFTTRWWQFPEISLRTGTVFHDRRAPENSKILSQKPCYLLFSAQNPPDKSTKKTLCGKILFNDGDLFLCEYHPAPQL